MPVIPPQPPSKYKPDEWEKVLDDIAAQIDSEIGQLQGKLDDQEEPEVGIEVPPASEAVTLLPSPDGSADLWDTETVGSVDYSGPGRVWRTHSVENPANVRRAKAVRYRIDTRTLRFGVMSVRLLDSLLNPYDLQEVEQTGSDLEIQYGVILTDIPWLGASERPRRILQCESIGYQPGSGVAVVSGSTPSWKSNTPVLGEEKSDDVFDTNAPTLWEAFSDSNLTVSTHNWFAPDDNSSTYVDEIEGLGYMLVTGENALEVYAQLNSRPSANLPMIGGNLRGEYASCPPELGISSPCPANITAIDDASGSSTKLVSIRADDLQSSTDRFIVEGLPIRYRNCEPLRVSRGFSLAIMVLPPKIVSWGDLTGSGSLFLAPSHDQKAACWATSGVRFTKENDRETVLDIVVI